MGNDHLGSNTVGHLDNLRHNATLHHTATMSHGVNLRQRALPTRLVPSRWQTGSDTHTTRQADRWA